MTFWISFIGYESVWFCAVIGAQHGHWWPGAIALLLYASWQWRISRQRTADLGLMLTAITLGCLLDGSLQHAGLIEYVAAWPATWLPPAWILALWAAFALTFTQSLKYLQTRLWMAALLGAIGGPLAYLGAARGWQVVTFAQPGWPALLWLAAGWGVATPLLAWLAKHWSRSTFAVPLSWREQNP